MVDIGELSENMRVRARDGEEIGTIIRLEGPNILVERGISFLRDELIPVALVTHVRDGDVYLSATFEALRGQGEVGAAGSDRTLREEAAAFAHEGDELGTHVPDNLEEGDGATRPDG